MSNFKKVLSLQVFSENLEIKTKLKYHKSSDTLDGVGLNRIRCVFSSEKIDFKHRYIYLDHKLGRGDDGVVYSIQEELTKSRYAIKLSKQNEEHVYNNKSRKKLFKFLTQLPRHDYLNLPIFYMGKDALFLSIYPLCDSGAVDFDGNVNPKLNSFSSSDIEESYNGILDGYHLLESNGYLQGDMDICNFLIKDNRLVLCDFDQMVPVKDERWQARYNQDMRTLDDSFHYLFFSGFSQLRSAFEDEPDAIIRFESDDNLIRFCFDYDTQDSNHGQSLQVLVLLESKMERIPAYINLFVTGYDSEDFKSFLLGVYRWYKSMEMQRDMA